MFSYAILNNPGHNRVYFEAAKKLSFFELTIAGAKLSSAAENIRAEVIAGVNYLVFDSANKLEQRDFELLSRLSFCYAIFEMDTTDRICFFPVEKANSYYFADDLNSILKYSGKTNELFTRLMINTAVLAGEFSWEEGLNVIDPLCGKGTTLFESLTLGYNAFGVEMNGKILHEAQVYFKKYLETGRYKHSFKKEKTGVEDKRYMADKYGFTLARSKDDLKNERSLKLEMVEGDSVRLDRYFKKESFHAIVGDLPYGVQHGGKTGGGKELSRSPLGLLQEALPAWYKVLKKGGTVALAYNRFVIKRNELERVLEENRFLPLTGEEFNSFEHRVDQAIIRDIVLARRCDDYGIAQFNTLGRPNIPKEKQNS